MAVMHPEDYLERYEPTESEQKMFEALRDQLPDGYHVYYSVRWFAEELDSEADFIIVDMDRGYLCLEVKGGLSLEAPETAEGPWFLEEGRRDGKEKWRRLRRSPYRQAENSMLYFKRCYEEEEEDRSRKRDYRGLYGCAVAFPMFNLAFKRPTVTPQELTITCDDIENGRLEERVDQLFNFWGRRRAESLGQEGAPVKAGGNQRLNLGPLMTEFREMLEKTPEVRVPPGVPLAQKRRAFARFDFLPESWLDLLQNCPRALILGSAGTGKTDMLLAKACRDLGRLGRGGGGRRVLAVCPGRELADELDCRITERLEREDRAEDRSRCAVRAWEDLPKEGGASGNYDAVLVDEGQDFDRSMAQEVLKRLAPEGELYVFADPDQGRSGEETGRSFGIGSPPFTLGRNLGNTREIWTFARSCSGKGGETEPGPVSGAKPRIYPVKDPEDPDSAGCYSDGDACRRELEVILRELKDEIRGRVDARSMVLLSDRPYDASLLAGRKEIAGLRLVTDRPLREMQEGELCFRTVEQFRGMRTGVVIYLEDVRGDRPTELERGKAYVPLTRAQCWLYVLRIRRGR